MDEITILVTPGTPARSDASGAARILGMSEHDIPTLVRARLLIPLGHPSAWGTKYFATCELIRLANDVKWLSKASLEISRFWKNKNNRRTGQKLDAAA